MRSENSKMSPFENRPRVVIVGGSIGGHALAMVLTKTIIESSEQMPQITVIEPRRGVMNAIAVPRSMVEPGFAEITFEPPSSFSKHVLDNVDFIHSLATNMTDKSVTVDFYGKPVEIPFEFCVVATGRKRQSYVMPPEPTKAEYVDVMNSYVSQFKTATKIVIVGGGAVGIEIAGEVKYLYPQKSVTLIHSRKTLPPEMVSDGFKDQTLEALDILGVNVVLETRAIDEVDGRVITADGRFFESDCTVWCTSRGRCNTDFMDDAIFSSSKDSTKDGALKVKKDMSVIGFPHIFAIGDVNDFPVIKTAGGAIYQANIVGSNIIRAINISRSLYSDQSTIPEPALLEPWGPHMAIIIGQKMGVAQTIQAGLIHDYAQVAEMFGEDMSTATIWKSLGITGSGKNKQEKEVEPLKAS